MRIRVYVPIFLAVCRGTFSSGDLQDGEPHCDKPGALKSANFNGCYESMCCENPGFGCYKRNGKMYAMCRPLHGPIKDCRNEMEWICPGQWSKPWLQETMAHATSCSGKTAAANFQDCSTTKCCITSGYGCFQREGTNYAQCRPLRGTLTSCESSDGWVCPLDWELPAPKSKLPTVLNSHAVYSYKLHAQCPPGGFLGHGKYSNCWDGMHNCCKDPGFGCFQRIGKPYAQCRPLGGSYESCRSTKYWKCPGDWEFVSSLSPPPPKESFPTSSSNAFDKWRPYVWMIACLIVLVLTLSYVGMSLYRKHVVSRQGDAQQLNAHAADDGTGLGSRQKSGDNEEEASGEAVFHVEGTTQGVVMGTTCLEQCAKGVFVLVDTFL